MRLQKNICAQQKGDVSPRHNLRRSLFAFFAAFSLLFQLLVPLDQSWAHSSLKFDLEADDVFIICTPRGLRVLSLNSEDDGQPIESSLDLSCPACSLTSVTIAPLPVSVPISRRYDALNTATWFVHSHPTITVSTAPLPARGPPEVHSLRIQKIVLKN